MIPMQTNLDKVTNLYHGEQPFEHITQLKAFSPFSDEVCAFLAALSQTLLADKEAKTYPDVVTFAFFCRKANIEHEKAKYVGRIENRIGRGVTFHIAPSNVPINFAYTMVAGLLSGNACIVRVSTKPFSQTDIICSAIQKVFAIKNYAALKEYIAIVRYERDTGINAYFSSLCDIRVIWGGDAAIAEIRTTALPPRSFDITFADRYSLCVVCADNYLKETNQQKIAQDFYNDTYLYDQNACSAPRLMIWIGKKDAISQAKYCFWSALHDYAKLRYPIEPVIAVEKLMTVCRCAIDLENAKKISMPDNLISRIDVDQLSKDLPDYRCAGGSFIEYDDENLNSLKDIITKKYQTMSYIGFQPNELQNWVIKNGLSGIDRIVPVGQTADFTLVWDGYDLIYTMSRICNIV